MSKTYNLVGGGNVEKAVLAVTVTNGTPTSVTATKTGGSVSLVHDSTNDIWTGNVTPGTWTVTATDGTNSGSISVTVDDVKVYSRIVGMSELGGDYTKLEWVSSPGSSIDTGYYPVSACRIFAKLARLSASVYGYPFIAAQPSSASGRRVLYFGLEPDGVYYANGIVTSTYPSVKISSSTTVGTEFTLSTSGRSITVNGTTYSVTQGSAITSVFDRTMNVGSYAKIWYFRMTAADANTYVRDMLPAKRNLDSVVGMYDKINSVFYPTSDWTAGPAV